jgi:hypothetical protein
MRIAYDERIRKMIEKTIYDFLKAENLSANPYVEVPSPQPKKFIVIEKTGSSRRNRLETSTIVVQSYADTLFGAAQLNEEVKQAMLDGLLTEDSVTSVSLNGDYNYTDTTTKSYRYQAVFLVTHY